MFLSAVKIIEGEEGLRWREGLLYGFATCWYDGYGLGVWGLREGNLFMGESRGPSKPLVTSAKVLSSLSLKGTFGPELVV